MVRFLPTAATFYFMTAICYIVRLKKKINLIFKLKVSNDTQNNKRVSFLVTMTQGKGFF